MKIEEIIVELRSISTKEDVTPSQYLAVQHAIKELINIPYKPKSTEDRLDQLEKQVAELTEATSRTARTQMLFMPIGGTA